MGLGIAVVGSIGGLVLFLTMAIIPNLSDELQDIQNANSDILLIEKKIYDTRLIFPNNIYALGGGQFVNFTLKNIGSEKLWDYDNFNLVISYDANIAGQSQRVTDVLTYVSGGFQGTESDELHRAEFKVQRGTVVMPDGDQTVSITEGTDFDECVGSCFIKQISTKFSSMGEISGGGHDHFDDFTTYISAVGGLTSSGGDVTFTRDDDPGDIRITWEIWEYVGDIGGPNEMVVLDIGICTFGTTPILDLTCNGSIVGGVTDDSDVSVFITGMGNRHSGHDEVQTCLVTSSWDSILDRSVFTRGEVGSVGCEVSYAVVEWIGSNWSVQRISHSFTNAQTSPSQTETITSVGDISRAFFHTQQQNGESNDIEDVCHAGTEVELTDSTTLTYRIPYQNSDAGWTTSVDMDAVTWIISNSETDELEKMIVNHYNPSPRPTGGSQEDNWEIGISALRNGMLEAAITGFSTQTDNCNDDWPRSFISAKIKDTASVEFWQSDTGSANEYTFQVTEFPHLDYTNVELCNGDSVLSANKWMIGNITSDHADPNIVNPGETMHICSQISNPLWPTSLIEVMVMTNDGFSVNSFRLLP